METTTLSLPQAVDVVREHLGKIQICGMDSARHLAAADDILVKIRETMTAIDDVINKKSPQDADTSEDKEMV